MAFSLPDLPYAYGCSRPAHVEGDAGVPSRQAPQCLRDDGQRPDRGYRVRKSQPDQNCQEGLRGQDTGPDQPSRTALQSPAFLELDESPTAAAPLCRAKWKRWSMATRLRQGPRGLHSGRRHAVRLGLGVARGARRQARSDQDGQRRKPADDGCAADPGCDVWEHSYYIDYRNARPKYLEVFFDSLVNWDYVEGMCP